RVEAPLEAGPLLGRGVGRQQAQQHLRRLPAREAGAAGAVPGALLGDRGGRQDLEGSHPQPDDRHPHLVEARPYHVRSAHRPAPAASRAAGSPTSSASRTATGTSISSLRSSRFEERASEASPTPRLSTTPATSRPSARTASTV